MCPIARVIVEVVGKVIFVPLRNEFAKVIGLLLLTVPDTTNCAFVVFAFGPVAPVAPC